VPYKKHGFCLITFKAL